MADAFTRVADLINTPPGQLLAGSALAGIVWKFFGIVEAALTDQTKFEIAVWLVGVSFGQKAISWPETFSKIFARFFGPRHFTWHCFWRSCVVSLSLVVIIVGFAGKSIVNFVGSLPMFVLVFCIVPDYSTLLKSRCVLLGLVRWKHPIARILLIVGDTYITMVIASCAIWAGSAFVSWSSIILPSAGADYWRSVTTGMQVAVDTLRSGPGHGMRGYLSLDVLRGNVLNGIGKALIVYPAFFTSIWLWLYVSSGFLIKAAQRFDIGFQWFNRTFDIEKKPLSAVGIVAG